MHEGIYQDEPIPKRTHAQSTRGTHADAPREFSRFRFAPRTPMNGSRPDARETVARIMADDRFLSSEYITARRHERDEEHMRDAWPNPHDEPPINLGAPVSRSTFPRATEPTSKQAMASQMPQGYRDMLALSRWEANADGRSGRWLSEAELFYRQGKLIEDLEDDYPLQGSFKSYFPTYNAMSDRQLRAYVTWRTAVRRGNIEEAPLSFAYVYLYELINGIGVANPEDGFRKLEVFWQTYREYAPEIDRFAGVWLQDYVVYHGLTAKLLEPYKTLSFDRTLIALRKADADVRQLIETPCATPGNGSTSGKAARRKADESVLPLPAHTALEDELFQAIDGLSTYRLSGSKLYKEHAEALRHVACAVYVRMSEYHQKNRKGSLLESWFGEEVTLPYTMFGSAVFYAPQKHADCVYALDEIHRYRCFRGYWTCERFHGGRAKSPKLGAMMHEVDRTLREALAFDHPLKKTSKIPKYLQAFIDREVNAWLTWHAAHAPRRIAIDLSQLDDIRSAASLTRESLLIDEEREGGAASLLLDVLTNPCRDVDEVIPNTITEAEEPQGPASAEVHTAAEEPQMAPLAETQPMTTQRGTPQAEDSGVEGYLSAVQVAYLQALISQNAQARRTAVDASGRSEDMLVDAINEACFDLIGDTVIEYSADGPELIEDYRDDVEGFIRHD